jgi:hypothetical protein
LPEYNRILKFFLISSLALSQIWLIPLVDNHYLAGYITKLGKEKKKKALPGTNDLDINYIIILLP